MAKNQDSKPEETKVEAALAAPAPVASRGKWYRVKGPGSVKLNGVVYAEGSTLQASEADACSIDGYLEPFTETEAKG